MNDKSVDTPSEAADSKPSDTHENKRGAGLVGLAKRPLDSGDKAYFMALDYTEEQIEELVGSIRGGPSPMLRRAG